MGPQCLRHTMTGLYAYKKRLARIQHRSGETGGISCMATATLYVMTVTSHMIAKGGIGRIKVNYYDAPVNL